MKAPGRLVLVVTQCKRPASARYPPQFEGEIFTGSVARQVFRRITDPDQRLLEPAPVRRVHQKAAPLQTFAQQRGHRLLPRDLLSQREVIGG